MTIIEAKSFINELYKKGLMFHFDDGATDCLYHNGVCTLNEARKIDKKLDQIYEANFDWGKYGCPIGYSLSLEKESTSLNKAVEKP